MTVDECLESPSDACAYTSDGDLQLRLLAVDIPSQTIMRTSSPIIYAYKNLWGP